MTNATLEQLRGATDKGVELVTTLAQSGSVDLETAIVTQVNLLVAIASALIENAESEAANHG